MGALLAPPGGLVMALPCQTVRPQGRAIAMGVYFVYFMYFYGGMGVLLPVAGLARDLTGSTATPLWFAGALLFIAIGCCCSFAPYSRTPRLRRLLRPSRTCNRFPPGAYVTDAWSLPLSPASAVNHGNDVVPYQGPGLQITSGRLDAGGCKPTV
jgi:hypothetical protein